MTPAGCGDLFAGRISLNRTFFFAESSLEKQYRLVSHSALMALS
jgi:hypothetical protein